MSQMKDFYSKSVAEAIRQACSEFGTSQENLKIDILETGSAGIFGLCRKRAHIRVGLKKEGRVETTAPEPEREAPVTDSGPEIKAADEPEPLKPRRKEPVPERKRKTLPVEKTVEPPSDEAVEGVRAGLVRFLSLMGMESEVTARFDGGHVQCHISGPFEEDIVGPEGRTLDSLQYLLRKMMSRSLPDRVSIDIDAGNFRERRIEELKKRAVELAELVKEDGKTQAIPALNPSERRVVHVILQDDKEVRSRSVGDGLFKKVLIYKPGKSRKKSGSRRRGRQGGRPADK